MGRKRSEAVGKSGIGRKWSEAVGKMRDGPTHSMPVIRVTPKKKVRGVRPEAAEAPKFTDLKFNSRINYYKNTLFSGVVILGQWH